MYQTSEYLEPKEGLEMFDPHQVGAEKSWMLRLIFFFTSGPVCWAGSSPVWEWAPICRAVCGGHQWQRSKGDNAIKSFIWWRKNSICEWKITSPELRKSSKPVKANVQKKIQQIGESRAEVVQQPKSPMIFVVPNSGQKPQVIKFIQVFFPSFDLRYTWIYDFSVPD